MPTIRLEDLTPFGRAAVKLDQELSELARAGAQIAQVDVESDGGMDEAVKILNRVARYGQSVAETMQDFALRLQEARDKADAATKLVAERAQLVKARHARQQALEGKLSDLRERMKAAGSSASPAKPQGGRLSEEDRDRIKAELERLRAPLDGFVEAARALKAEAAGAKVKRLERQADAMIDSLQATLRKIAQALAEK